MKGVYIMFYSKETQIAKIEYRINLLRQRGEVKNLRLINALIRKKNNINSRAF